MKPYAASTLVLLAAIGVAMSVGAGAPASPPSESPLSGKFVVISHKGMSHGVSDNVRFESVGQHDYVVIPGHNPVASEPFECWIPLDDVVDIKVFESKRDAERFDKVTSPVRSHVERQAVDPFGG